MSIRAFLFLGVALVWCAPGCKTTDGKPVGGGDEKALRDQFAALQAALKNRDGEKLLGLLDDDGKSDAERAAKTLREAYDKADDAKKKDIEQKFDLSAAELKALTAAGFLKSKRFVGAKKINEIADSTFDKVEIQGDKATLHYIEEDKDHEKLSLVKQGGSWRFSFPMPPATP
jgi:hypothetical protein